MKRGPLIILAVLSCFLCLPSLEAQESTSIIIHKPGDLSFSILGGGWIPLFNIDMNLDIQDSGIQPGMAASLNLDWYLSNWISLGIIAKGFQGKSVNGNSLYVVPLMGRIRGEYHFLEFFSGGLFFDLGVSMVKYLDYGNVDGVVSTGIDVFWHRGNTWAFGAQGAYTIQIQEAAPRNLSRFINFGEFSFAVKYFQ